MSDEPVSEKELSQILESGNWAPTHGLTEPWRYNVYRGDSRKSLADGLASIYESVTPKAKFRQSKVEKLATVPLKAPVCIVVWMKRQAIRKIPEIEEIGAVACAIQNMHLTAAAMGLGAFWSSPSILYTDAMNEWLDIGSEDKCLGLFYIGRPREGLVWPSSQRSPIEDKTKWLG
ncbi:MAG: nitroreductase [Rhodothermales bacterium]|nr:nitroreductase [Rhodothermales bacterium]